MNAEALKIRTRKKQKKEVVSHQLRLPKDLDNWLVNYSSINGFSSEMEAVRHFIREHRKKTEQPEPALAPYSLPKG